MDKGFIEDCPYLSGNKLTFNVSILEWCKWKMHAITDFAAGSPRGALIYQHSEGQLLLKCLEMVLSGHNISEIPSQPGFPPPSIAQMDCTGLLYRTS